MADQGSKANIYARIKNRMKHHGRERESERMDDQGSQAKIYAGMENHIKHHGTLVLREVDDVQASYMCGLCVTPGFGPRYDCSRCEMRIHRHCASRLQLSQPCFLHPDQHHMSLVVVGEGVLPCKACNGAIAGAHYECTREGRAVRIHPLCLLLRFEPPGDPAASATPGGGQMSSTVHWLHEEHPLKDLYSPKEYVCDGCGAAGIGRRLRCGEGCDFALHPYCSSLPREEQREPCFLCGPAGAAAHGSSFRTADPSWKGRCRLCNDEISRTETAGGIHLWCQESRSAAHPLCARLRQLEQTCRTQNGTTTDQNASGPGGDQVAIWELKNAGGASRNPDEVAGVLSKAQVVAGKLAQHLMYHALAKAVFDGGQAVYAAYIEPAHVGDACLAAAADAKAHLVDGVSDAVHGVEEAGTSVLHEVSDAFHGVKEAGTSVLHEVSYAFHGVEHGVEEAAKSVLHEVSDAFHGVEHGVEEAATSVLHEVSDAFHGVEEAGTSVLEAVLNVLETLSNFF